MTINLPCSSLVLPRRRRIRPSAELLGRDGSCQAVDQSRRPSCRIGVERIAIGRAPPRLEIDGHDRAIARTASLTRPLARTSAARGSLTSLTSRLISDVGRLPLGLGLEVGADAVPQHRDGDLADVVERDAEAAVHRGHRLAAEDQVLAGARAGAAVDQLLDELRRLSRRSAASRGPAASRSRPCTRETGTDVTSFCRLTIALPESTFFSSGVSPLVVAEQDLLLLVERRDNRPGC